MEALSPIRNVCAAARLMFAAFTDCVFNTNSDAWQFSVSGTGASFGVVANGTNNAVGILRAALGTTATGRCGFGPNNMGIIRFSQGEAKACCRATIVTLSDATNTYTLRIGFIDSVSAEPTDGAYFRYTHGTNSGKWQAVTRSNGSENATDTGVTAAINTWSVFEVKVNAAGTSVEFYINNALVATHTTAANIPTASGRETGYGIAAIRSAGTAAINCYDVDYFGVEQLLSTAR